MGKVYLFDPKQNRFREVDMAYFVDDNDKKMNGPWKDSGVGNAEEHINLKVVGQDSIEHRFRVKRTAKLSGLMADYSEKVGALLSSLRFLFHGRRVRNDDTPDKLEMAEEDVIEVYQEMSAGGMTVSTTNL